MVLPSRGGVIDRLRHESYEKLRHFGRFGRLPTGAVEIS
jgi:hypothetical protein